MRNVFLLMGVCVTLLLMGCSNNDTVIHEEEIAHPKTNRTVVAYFVGDVNLWYALEESVNQLERGWDKSIDGTLLVYLDNSNHLTQFGRPVLLEITHDDSHLIVSKVVKEYDDQDAGDPNVLNRVLTDAATLYPADSHGLIIGTHGNGWLPNTMPEHQTKGLAGPDRYGSTLEIDALAKNLPVKYEFIAFHACCMSNIETVYQLRNNCDYIMASAWTLPGDGYPYELITPYFFTKPHADLYKAAAISAQDYATSKDSSTFDLFTVEVIKTSELERLAAATAPLVDDLRMSYDEIRKGLFEPNDKLQGVPGENYVIDYSQYLLIDLNGLYFLSANEPLKKAYKDALAKAIIQHYVVNGNDTQQIARKIGLSLASDPTTTLGVGLSFYLPYNLDNPVIKQFNQIFKNNYDWAKASGFDKDR